MLSPGTQVAICPGLHVTVHLGQGGGPTTLHEAGIERSHPVEVGVGVANFFDLLEAAPTIDIGKSAIATVKMTNASALLFKRYFDLTSM